MENSINKWTTAAHNKQQQQTLGMGFPELPHCNIQIVQFTKKNIKHTNKQKIMDHSQRKKLAETIPEEAQILDLVDKDITYFKYV